MKRALRPCIFCFLTMLLALLLFPVPGHSLPAPMDPPRLVNDFAGVFTEGERDALEQQVRDYHNSTTTQIYIVTVSSLEGRPALEYATALGNAWGVGQKDKDNGIVLLMKPKTARENGEVAIALGQGVERVISQRAANGIIQNSLLPLFRKGLFAEGVQQTVHTLGLLLAENFSPRQDASAQTRYSPPPQQTAPPVQERLPSPPQAETYSLPSPPQTFPPAQTTYPPTQTYPPAQQAPDDYRPPAPPQKDMKSPRSQRSEPADPSGVYALVVIGIFALFLGILVVTGHGKLAGKILLGILAAVGTIFAMSAIFGRGSSRSRGRAGGGFSGGGFSGGGGGRFSGGGASGSW